MSTTSEGRPAPDPPKMQHPEQQQRDLRKQRTRAVRTAWVLAVVAVLIFAAFVLSGLFGEAPGA